MRAGSEVEAIVSDSTLQTMIFPKIWPSAPCRDGFEVVRRADHLVEAASTDVGSQETRLFTLSPNFEIKFMANETPILG